MKAIAGARLPVCSLTSRVRPKFQVHVHRYNFVTTPQVTRILEHCTCTIHNRQLYYCIQYSVFSIIQWLDDTTENTNDDDDRRLLDHLILKKFKCTVLRPVTKVSAGCGKLWAARPMASPVCIIT